MDVIIKLAYKYNLFCPDIILNNAMLEMKFVNDNKYLIFTFNKDDKITVSIGELGKEKVDLQWSVESDMQIFSEFLYE